MKKNAAKATIVAALAFAGVFGVAGPALAADSVPTARSSAALGCTDLAHQLADDLRSLGANVPHGTEWQTVYLYAYDWAARHPGETAEQVKAAAERLRSAC
ncbi:hypothetical protein [Streptomyces sp. NPDC001815]|uniref:hypothetical protein n=1 Tax=Streptomyces sp. NPDC001815 TaxID=3154526 RepID=UPI00332D4997